MGPTLKISFIMPDESMPRTVYYDLFAAAVRRNPRYVEDNADADICLPAEDIALERHWPRYGKAESAFVRGSFDLDRVNAYADALVACGRRVCIVNMVPFLRWPQFVAQHGEVFVADISVAGFERLMNPRTISMPALPIVAGPGTAGSKSVLASFRGIASHPCRERLKSIHDGTAIFCEFVEPANHIGRIDAMAGNKDESYAALMAASIFAFVPRGDALFSYRLLEAMSFGCIPVILSDHWLPPFDRTIAWNEIALHVPEHGVADLPRLLRTFEAQRIAAIQQAVIETYRTCFANLDCIAECFFRELEIIMETRVPYLFRFQSA
ncbi:MAG TPA: exostosin family protein [Rhizomicrobium sp.]|nr:exostosin family protein [Rhizomicrobium sp.]